MLTSLTALLDAQPINPGSALRFILSLAAVHAHVLGATNRRLPDGSMASKGTLISVQTVLQGDHYRSLAVYLLHVLCCHV